jgi:hypothetical protein
MMDGHARLPQGLFLEGPPILLPVRALGPVVTDARGQNIANCPTASLADAIAWSINTLNGVHDHAR